MSSMWDDRSGLPLAIRQRINRMEYATKRSSHRDRHEPSKSEYWGNASPTCPPSTQIIFRAGWFWNADSGGGWWSKALTAELGTGGNCEVSSFTNVGYYKGIIIHHVHRNLLSTESSEYSTIKETIEKTLSLNMGTIYSGQMPLVLIIVKNNGSIGTPGAVLQIDRINRGNSFMYRQFRPWLHYHASVGPD